MFAKPSRLLLGRPFCVSGARRCSERVPSLGGHEAASKTPSSSRSLSAWLLQGPAGAPTKFTSWATAFRSAPVKEDRAHSSPYFREPLAIEKRLQMASGFIHLTRTLAQRFMHRRVALPLCWVRPARSAHQPNHELRLPPSPPRHPRAYTGRSP